MTSTATLTSHLDIQEFWRWLGNHFNCILRAGGAGFLLFDQPDLHWHQSEDPDGLLVMQLIRGKETTAELYINPRDVLSVTSSAEEGEQTLFELLGSDGGEAVPLCHFLMAHPFDDDEGLADRPLTH